jgi:hypothetical protein
MPQWLCNQLMRAFHSKNRRQIRMLNDCWFFYRNKSDRGILDGRKQQKP